MPQDIIAQFDRKYNAPIETRRQVADITARNSILSTERWEGMLVYVVSEQATFELRGGLDDSAWSEFVGLPDAPADGNYYARRNNAWETIAATGETSGSGTSGIVLRGLTSGSHTIGSQYYSWTKNGTLVNFVIDLEVLGGTTSGELFLDISGTTLPGFIDPLPNLYGSMAEAAVAFFASNFYEIKAVQSINSGLDGFKFIMQTTLNGSNITGVFNASFGGEANSRIQITGTYITA